MKAIATKLATALEGIQAYAEAHVAAMELKASRYPNDDLGAAQLARSKTQEARAALASYYQPED